MQKTENYRIIRFFYVKQYCPIPFSISDTILRELHLDEIHYKIILKASLISTLVMSYVSYVSLVIDKQIPRKSFYIYKSVFDICFNHHLLRMRKKWCFGGNGNTTKTYLNTRVFVTVSYDDDVSIGNTNIININNIQLINKETK